MQMNTALQRARTSFPLVVNGMLPTSTDLLPVEVLSDASMKIHLQRKFYETTNALS